MSGSPAIEAFLDSWMVDSGEFPELHVGQDAELSLCARVRALDGVGEVPDSATNHPGARTRAIEGVVTWVHQDDERLHLVVQHAGTLLAAHPAVFQGPRRTTWRDRLSGHRGIPEFLPVRLPAPAIGQVVTLECTISVLAEYELAEMWPGPEVSARYRIESIDAELITPQPLPTGADEFDDVVAAASRTVTGLSSTRPPPGLVELEVTDDGGFNGGEEVSNYRFLLTPVDPLS